MDCCAPPLCYHTSAVFPSTAPSLCVLGQEDIDHFLIHGTFLHGEWFLEGQRCPGGDHREALPADSSITERPLAVADFPEVRQRLDIYDGCPNQFAYCDQFHQIAVWRAKTARWAKHRLADAAAAAAVATSTAAAAASTACTAAAAAASAAQNGWVQAAARATPNATYHVTAATTVHRLSAAAAVATSKLTDSAVAACTAADAVSTAAVLSASVAAAAVTSATTTHRLAVAAAKAAASASDATSAAVLSHQVVVSDATSTTASAAAAAASAVAAAKAASDAIAPPMDVDGVPVSPAAAARIAAAPALDGIVRMAIKLVEHHGKSGCDGNSNTPVLALKYALQHGLIGPNPGTRQLVLWLAEHKPFTSTPKAKKRGWEAIGRIFYGFMNTDRFTKQVVPDSDASKGFKDSSKHHSFVGRHTSSQVFASGEMQACHEFCPCDECLSGRYRSCQLMSEMGSMHPVAVPWVSGPPLRQLEELAAWGELLKSGMIVAFTADAADVWMEGSYWLALINGPAFPVPESQVCTGSCQPPHMARSHPPSLCM